MLNKTIDTPLPWWKFWHVWLVISGPAVVVVAGFFTLYLAITIPDPLVTEDYYRKGAEINKTRETTGPGLTPAMQARNHAATGVEPEPKGVNKP